MIAQGITAVLLGLAVLMASIRLILWHRTALAPSRPRLVALLLFQPACAVLLFLTLFPPATTVSGGTLRVSTTGANILLLSPSGASERVPDLGTALRRHPDTKEIVVTGNGLSPRDLDAARSLAVRFDPPAPRPGITHIAPPPPTAPGASFIVGAQLTGLPRATVDLIDPAGHVTDSTSPSPDGQVTLSGTARAAGNVLFTLRVRDGRRTIEQASIPVLTEDRAQPRLLIMAGAPGPEVKYLRRWASDAGFAVTVQTSAGGGIAIGDPPISIDGATLRRFDAVIIDDRSWAMLGARRAALMGAVRDGLGLILRAGGPIDATTLGQWRALGFGLTGQTGVAPLALPKAQTPDIAGTRDGIGNDETPTDIALPDEMLPEVSRLAMTPDGGDAVPLLRDAGGTPLSAWRAIGTGRVALFTGLDSYALTLTGHRTLYGDWWSAMLSTVARPAPGAMPMTNVAWAGERMALCGLTGTAQVERPDGRRAQLLPVGGCAAFWPDQAGWHILQTSRPTPIYVQPADALPTMRASRNRDATLMLRSSTSATTAANVQHPGPSWPYALGWLILSALLWWLERARLGRAAPPQSAK